MNCANHKQQQNQEPAQNSGSAMSGEGFGTAEKLRKQRMERLAESLDKLRMTGAR